jgi:hypothetical protein
MGLSVLNGAATAQAAPEPQGMGWSADDSGILPPTEASARLNEMHVEASPVFAQLAPEDRFAALAVLSKNPSDASLAEHILTVSGSTGFTDLPGAARAEAWKALAKLAGSPPGRAAVVRWLSGPELPHLPAADQERSIAVMAAYAATGRPTMSLEQLLGGHAFGALDAHTRAHLFDQLEATSQFGAFADAVPHLLSEPAVQRLDVAARAQLLDVASRMAREGATLHDMPDLQVLLQRLDQKQLTATLAQLWRVAKAAGNDRLVIDQVQELANPARYVNQGNRGTCTVTSMTYRLAMLNPAEYARLATELVLTGKTRLANGAAIAPPADAFAPDASGRSTGERLLQSALMKFAATDYSNAKLEEGLDFSQMSKVASALYDFQYVSQDSGAYKAMVTALQHGQGPVLVALKWETASHAVEVTHVQDGKVYLRNPWGAQDLGNYTQAGPQRQAVNPAETIDTMSIEAFSQILLATFVPAPPLVPAS